MSQLNTYPMQTLKISDGTTTVDLLSPRTGFYPMEWTPSAADVKNGGVWHDNAISDGRSLIDRPLQNTTDTFTLAARGWTQDLLIREMNKLRNLLMQGTQYWTRRTISHPVWIQARGWNETGDRYSVVIDYRMPQSIDPYGEEFTGSAAMPGTAALELYIEHEPFWSDTPPDDPECLPLYNYQDACTLYPARFEGTTGTGVITVAPHALINNLHVGASFQVEFWIYVNALHAGINGRVADKMQGTVNGWRIYINSVGRLEMQVGCAVTVAFQQTAIGAVPLQEWTHVVCVYDDTTDRIPHFAINGIWDPAAGTAGVGAAGADAANSLTFGNNVALTHPLDGDLGPIRIYPKITYDVGLPFVVPRQCVMFAYEPGMAWMGIYEGQGTSVANLASIGAATGTMAPENWGDCCARPVGNTARTMYKLQASADDCYVDHVGAAISLAGASLLFGDGVGTSYETGMRFSSLFSNVPSNRTIRVVDARLSFHGSGGLAVLPEVMDVTAEQNSAPAAFTTYANFVGRPRLTQTISWPCELFALGEPYSSVNLALLIQEAIDQAGWEHGGEIVLFVGNSVVGVGRQIASVDSATYPGPYLDVIYTLDGEDVAPTCEEQRVYTINHWQKAQISHVYLYDSGFFSGNLVGAVMPQPLLPSPASIGANDALYIGIDTTILDSGPFCSLVFNLDPAGSDYTATWEYWNGAWVALSVQDNTNADGAMTGTELDTAGVHSVHWEIPANWVTTVVNGITGYWVRLRVTAVGGAPAEPYQVGSDIYTLTEPWVACSAYDVRGNMTALARWLHRSQSDHDDSAVPTLATSCLYAGVKLGNDSDFCAFLNCADRQTPVGVSCTAMGAAAFATDPRAPAGRWMSLAFAPAALTLMARYSFAQEVVASYVGEYRALVRAYYSAGVPPQFTLVINMPYETGRYGPGAVEGAAGTYDRLADLGRVVIPGPSYMTEQDERIGMLLDLYVYGDGAQTVTVSDLILLPADVAFYGFENTRIGARSLMVDSAVLPFVLRGGVLDVDSISMPKNRRRALARRHYNDRVYASSPWGGTSPLWVDNVQTTRLWVLYHDSGYAAGVRVSVAEIEAANSHTAFLQRRYQDMRGAE